MNVYVDSSLIVALLARERHTDRAIGWLAGMGDRTLVASDWVATEVASALALKVRMREISDEDRVHLATIWRDLRMANFAQVAIESRHFSLATDFVGRPGIKLRASDALHLAITKDGNLAIATLDRDMAFAAKSLAIDVEGGALPD